jgi:hypothetical protein
MGFLGIKRGMVVRFNVIEKGDYSEISAGLVEGEGGDLRAGDFALRLCDPLTNG